ncbi:MAG: DUF1552 domain-containing protein [Myxococcales bacterium]
MSGKSRSQGASPRGGMLSRRQLLGALGASAFAAPWLPLLNVSGQEEAPRRLVLFFTPHGTVWDQFRPTGTETDFKLSRILQPLAAHQRKIVVLDGLGVRDDGPGAPHTKGPALLYTASPLLDDGAFVREDCSGGCTFGWNSAASMDQILAKGMEGITPYKSLEFGVRSGGGFPGAHISYAGPKTPMPPRQDPVAAFNELFANLNLPEGEAARLRRRREAMMKVVGAELSAIEARVPSADRLKVQAHRSALSDLQTQLFRPVPACTLPAKPNVADRPSDAADSVPWILDRQTELLVAALRCDLTRIASLQLRVGENDGYPYRFVGVDVEHHGISHETTVESLEKLATIYTWYADRFAHLLDLLDSVPEGDGTMLDNTLVIWGSEIGTGYTHDFGNVPFVVAGGGAHGVQTGRYLKVPKGTYHNRLLVSAMRFMGSNVDTFGTTDQERGSLPGLGV